MKAKEKAKELVKKYYNLVSGWTSINLPNEYPSAQYEGESMKIGRAKQCALMVADEIINEISLNKRLDWLDARKNGEEYVIYWESVKDEIKSIKE